MGLCVLYYVEYSLYNVKKVGFFLSGRELHFKFLSVETDFNCLTFYQTVAHFYCACGKRPFENITRIGENAYYQHFLLFPQCFLPYH